MVLYRTRFKFVNIVVQAEEFGNGRFQRQRSACYVTVHRNHKTGHPVHFHWPVTTCWYTVVVKTLEDFLIIIIKKKKNKINLKDCNSPFLEASQNIKAKTFVLKPTKFRFRLFCLISHKCTWISISHFEQLQNSVTQGQGHQKGMNNLSPTLVASWTLRSCSFWVWFPFKQCDKATAAHQFDNGSGLETRYKLSC